MQNIKSFPFDVSIVVPLKDEAESLPELCEWIDRVCTSQNLRYEIYLVDDGSTDHSWLVIQDLSSKFGNVHGIKFRRNYGKSAALNEGFKKAAGEVVITMNADLQDSPDEIPGLYKMIVEGGYDLVSGWKEKRYDPLSKTLPTKLFNWATRKISGIYLHDFNCGLKAYKNIVIKNVEVYGEMHRYIPVMAKWEGFTKIGEKSVTHQARKYGTSKFGLERFVNGFLDLLTLTFTGKFGKKPMHFFGTMGILMFFFGMLSAFYIIGFKLYQLYFVGEGARLVTDLPQFYLSLTLMIIGVQLFLAGFLAELVIKNNPDRNNYKIDDLI